MYKIIKKEILNRDITLFEVEAPDISKAARPGNFVIIRVDEEGERFPLTLYDWDAGKGTVTIVSQAVGVSTNKLAEKKEGNDLSDVAGPLGHELEIPGNKKVICVGGGVGTAEAFPVARAMKQAGCEVEVIIGARNKDLLICESDMKEFADNVHIATDDGTAGRKGLVTDILKELIEKDHYDMVFAIGPVPMMKAVSDITRPPGIETIVSLNALMVDGTGMCGCCRVRIDDETRFSCVDGPAMDGHLIDFNDLMRREKRYQDKEKEAMDHYCRIRGK